MRVSLLVVFLLASQSVMSCPLSGIWVPDRSRSLSELYSSNLGNAQKLIIGKIINQTKQVYYNKECDVVTFTFKDSELETAIKVEALPDNQFSVTDPSKENEEATILTMRGSCYSERVLGTAVNNYLCRAK